MPEFSQPVVDQMNEDLAQFKRDVSDIYKRVRKPDPRGAAVPVTVAEVRAQVWPITTKPATPERPPHPTRSHAAGLARLPTPHGRCEYE